MEPVTLDMRDYETVYLWRYPGCGGTAELATWYIRTEADNVLRFPAYWLDSQGRRWGGYSFFESDGFICLDEPGLEENLLPEVEQAGRIVPAADGRTLPRVHVPGGGKNTALWAAGGGLTLLLGLAAFFAFRKKTGKKPVKKGRG